MGAFSNDLETALLDHTLGSTSWAQPTSIYVGLCTTNPTDAAATKANGLKHLWWEKLSNAAEKAYGITGTSSKKWMKLRKMESRLLERHDLGQVTDAGGLTYKLNFSIDEAIKRYMEKLDPTLADNFSAKTALAGQRGLHRDILLSSTLLGDPAMPIR